MPVAGKTRSAGIPPKAKSRVGSAPGSSQLWVTLTAAKGFGERVEAQERQFHGCVIDIRGSLTASGKRGRSEEGHVETVRSRHGRSRGAQFFCPSPLCPCIFAARDSGARRRVTPASAEANSDFRSAIVVCLSEDRGCYSIFSGRLESVLSGRLFVNQAARCEISPRIIAGPRYGFPRSII